ncbi:hypothetical protein BRADI_2g20726v3 [Brachypodium distachyon]|uniref:Uncharacterized protein n=1 Tax=Brachypodium distachyon TaxID=15368 RepID=A0A2K2D9M9_BRADI|nr:hypothetical protein BRADI_2g20726v3 [Brachypodium distachyon]
MYILLLPRTSESLLLPIPYRFPWWAYRINRARIPSDSLKKTFDFSLPYTIPSLSPPSPSRHRSHRARSPLSSAVASSRPLLSSASPQPPTVGR